MTSYSVRLEIDGPTDPRNRLTTAFRVVLAVPALAVLCVPNWGRSSGLLTLPVVLGITFRQRYPR